MKYWTLAVVVLLAVVDFTSRHVDAETTDNNTLVTHASSIADLQYVLGPKYTLLVAGYWRYLSSPCSSLAERMAKDMANEVLKKYCMHLTRCPVMYDTQSCMVKIAVFTIRMSCCTDSAEALSTMTTQSTTSSDLTKTASEPFDLQNRQMCNYGRIFASGKIFGGTEARRGEFPWTIMVRKNGRFLCGGVLLDTTHVLTAAHCFDSHVPTDQYQVIAGKYSLTQTDETEQLVNVKSFVIHQNYNQATSWNDIALLALVQALKFNEWVVPACLPSSADILPQFCTVVGWGMTEGRVPPAVLMKVELQTYNSSKCYDEFKDTAEDLARYVHDGAICAANEKLGLKDACQGDSGSPLMCVKRTRSSVAWFVVGLVSNGNKCALPGDPGIYANIQYYLPWISTTIRSMF